ELLVNFIFRGQPLDPLYCLGMELRVFPIRRFDHLPKPDPLFGVYDYIIVLRGGVFAWVKMVNLASFSKANSNNLFHRASPLWPGRRLQASFAGLRSLSNPVSPVQHCDTTEKGAQAEPISPPLSICRSIRMQADGPRLH